MQPDSSVIILTAIIPFFSYLILKFFTATTHQLKHVPTIGRSGVVSSYVDAFRFFAHGHDMIQEGYDRYYGSAFKVPTLFKWVVIVSGPHLIDEIRRASDDQMSFDEFVAETLQTEYTLGSGIRQNTYHISAIRTPLTKNIAIRFSEVTDEIASVFTDLIPANPNAWTSVPALRTITKIICRTTNRFLVGLPLCRNSDYTDIIERFTLDIYLGGQIISLFPKLLKPIAARLLTRVPTDIERFSACVRPLIEAVLETEKRQDKSNNLINWLLDEAQGTQMSINDIVIRVLAINFVAIHTASNAFTHALYYLAAYPQYVPPMRKEVKTIIKSDGWTKDSMTKMHKIDSFIKESQRLSMGALAINRKIMKDFTFSNGLFLPKGTEVAIATYATHTDKRNYTDPLSFKPFRFSEYLEKDHNDSNTLKHDLVSPSPNYLSFGSGRHACPGRFFAANELKAMLVHILLNYDVKLPQGGPPPQNVWFQGAVIPNGSAQVMFRKRL